MKRLLFFCLIIFTTANGVAQTIVERKTIQILPNSELSLTGDTNINIFGCEFETNCLEETTEIAYSRNGNHLNFNDALLILKNDCFDCGNKSINKDFHTLLKSGQYPEIIMELTQIRLLDEKNGIASVNITIAGKKKKYALPIAITNFPTYFFVGTLKLDITDFHLKPPKKMFGLIVIKDEIEIKFNLAVK